MRFYADCLEKICILKRHLLKTISKMNFPFSHIILFLPCGLMQGWVYPAMGCSYPLISEMLYKFH